MQDAQQLFRIQPAVGDNAGNRGHNQRRYSQGGKQSADIFAHTQMGHIVPERNQPTTPNEKFEELGDG